MDNYRSAKELSNQMIEGMRMCADLVGKKDSSKSGAYGFVPGLEMAESQKFLEATSDKIKEGIFQVMFTGAFSSGKSTLLNALMRQEILTANITPETAIITKIIFGKDKKVIVVKKSTDPKTGEHYKEEMTVESFFNEYRVSQEDPDKFIKKVDYAILQLPDEGIGGNTVQLVDSPGTQNSAADNDIAHGFINKADAVVYLINAVEPFNQDDKEFIAKNYAGKHMQNLFFVINRIDCVSEDQIPNLESHAYNQLRDVFTRMDGNFDEKLFKSRVFYTNAYGALMARTNQPIKVMGQPIKIDESSTGVPEFEKALSEFLTDGGKDKAAFHGYLPQLARIYVEADEKIERTLEQYERDSESLTLERDEIERNKSLYETYISQIADCCRTCVSNIIDDARREYDSTINRIDSGWTKHFTDKGTKLKMGNIMGLVRDAFTGFFKSNEDKQKAMAERMQPLADDIQEYIKPETAKMANNLNQCIETRLKNLENQLTDISKALESLDAPISFDEIAKSLAKLGNDTINVGGGKTNTSLFQIIVGVIARDPETIIGGAVGNKSNSSVLIGTILKEAVEIIALYVVAWPVGLAMLAGRLFLMIKEGQANQRTGAMKILEEMKPAVLQSMRENKDRYAMEVESKMSAITRGGNTVTKGFQTELDSYITQLNDTINNLKTNGSAAAHEKARTDAIKQEMVKVLSGMNKAINGTPLNEAGIKKLA